MSRAIASQDINALAKGGRTNIAGFALRLAARMPFLFIAGRLYGPEAVGRYALAVVVVELAALVATLGLKRGLAQALASSDKPAVCVVWDGLAVAAVASLLVSTLLFTFPEVMYPHGAPVGLERFFAFVVIGPALSDVSLAALAYRHNVRAAVTARAIVEPWTISIAVWALWFITPEDGMVVAYMVAMAAALIASLVPLVREYGFPRGWRPSLGPLSALARANAPLAGADALEWGTRNVDRFILGLLFAPKVVGIYYMAQQLSSLPQKLKTSFDPILGPVITASLAAGDRAAVARQVRQVGFWIIAAQGCIALACSIPGEALMGVIGPQFVGGTAAMAILLTGEVLATQGAVSESALVYVARHLNLAISIVMLGAQIALSFGLIIVMRNLGWPVAWQAVGPALALAFSLALTSAIKALIARRLLGASVWSWRWSLLGAAGVAALVGTAFLQLPHRFEWVELVIGMPAIALAFAGMLGKWAFGPEDRALFRKMPRADEATLPNMGAATS